MAREASTATLYRNALRELKHLRKEYAESRSEAIGYRIRASKAEDEVAEWEKRFDALLARTPKVEV